MDYFDEKFKNVPVHHRLTKLLENSFFIVESLSSKVVKVNFQLSLFDLKKGETYYFRILYNVREFILRERGFTNSNDIHGKIFFEEFHKFKLN